MSIRDEIIYNVRVGNLCHLPLIVPGDKTTRHIYVTKEIYDALHPTEDQGEKWIRRMARLRADLDMFTRGQDITISFDPFKKKNSAYMAMTDPLSDAIWDLRSRDPKPGIRVLGGFSEQDVLICLALETRETLKSRNSKEWRDFIQRGKTTWTQLFKTYPRVSGKDARKYVSSPYTIV